MSLFQAANQFNLWPIDKPGNADVSKRGQEGQPSVWLPTKESCQATEAKRRKPENHDLFLKKNSITLINQFNCFFYY